MLYSGISLEEALFTSSPRSKLASGVNIQKYFYRTRPWLGGADLRIFSLVILVDIKFS